MDTSQKFSLRKWLSLKFPDPVVEQEFRADHSRDAVQVMRLGVIFACVLILLFMWQDNEISPLGYRATNIRIYLALPLCVTVWTAMGLPGAERYVEWMTAAFLIAFCILFGAICLVFEPGTFGIAGEGSSGSFQMLLVGTFTLAHLRIVPALSVGMIIVLGYTAAAYRFSQVDFAVFLNINLANMVQMYLLGATTCTTVERLRRRQFLARRELAGERERYKTLLFNLVPSQIAERIEHGEFPIADTQSETAILFSDFVGFTQLTKQISPRTLIELLNDLFYQFDLAAERHGVEKIKTIGDGYMAACGPPIAEQHRTLAMARFGLELVEITRTTAARFGLPLSIRVGIHTGNLIAGVIGKNRYTFDMWGESVNMASRMESSGVADRVQVSESAHQRLAGQFEFEARIPIDVKGIGEVQAYLLCAPEPKEQP